MSSIGPIVEVISSLGTPRGVRLVCRLSEPYGEPIAPGGFYESPDSEKEAFAVHRVAASNGTEVTFESFGTGVTEFPTPGAKLFYRGWWVKAAMDAALDERAAWQHRAYPDDGSHEHCLFTWETISSRTEVKQAYWSVEHGWVTEKAYEDFILHDLYHLREPRDA